MYVVKEFDFYYMDFRYFERWNFCLGFVCVGIIIKNWICMLVSVVIMFEKFVVKIYICFWVLEW